jgi:hypothetical protein
MQNNQINPEPTGPEAIALLNDELRLGLRVKSGITAVITSGIDELCGSIANHLGWTRQGELLRIVREYDDFSEGNNPHGERDFGSFEFRGVKCFWKIDYYDLDLQGGSPDPANPKVTRRVLTIMRADEY